MFSGRFVPLSTFVFFLAFSTEVSEGFQGFAALFPVYLDIPYSHTVEGIAAVTFFQIFCGWKLCHFVSQSCFEFANIEHSPQPITALGMAILGLLVAVLGRLFYGHSDVNEVLEWKLPGWHKMMQNAKLCLAVERSYCVKVTRNENQLDVSRIEAVMTWSLAVMKTSATTCSTAKSQVLELVMPLPSSCQLSAMWSWTCSSMMPTYSAETVLFPGWR